MVLKKVSHLSEGIRTGGFIRVGLRRGRHEAVDLVFGTTPLVQLFTVKGVSDRKRTQGTGNRTSAQTARYPARAKAPGNSAG